MHALKDKAESAETVFTTRIFCRKNDLNETEMHQAKSHNNTFNRNGGRPTKFLGKEISQAQILKLNLNRTSNTKGVFSSSKLQEQSSSTKEVSKKGEFIPSNRSYAQAVRNGSIQKQKPISVEDNPKLSNPQSDVKTKVSNVVTPTMLDTTRVLRKMPSSILPSFFQKDIMAPSSTRTAYPFSSAKKPLHREINSVFDGEKEDRGAASPLDSFRELEYNLDASLAGGDGLHIQKDSPTLHSSVNSKKPAEMLSSEGYRRIVGKKEFMGTGVRVNFPEVRSQPLASKTDDPIIFSRKVFVGGLPLELSEEEIVRSFQRFGRLVVDWPHRAEGKSYRYRFAFVFFQDEASVERLIEACIKDFGKYFLCISKNSGEYITLQVNPWRLTDALFIQNATMPIDPRKTALVGGVPRTIKAVELAVIMDGLYGGVSCVRIDVDQVYRYPKGIAFVSFNNQESYVSALSARFIQIRCCEGLEKRVEVKHCVIGNQQQCDVCRGERCEGKAAPFFCASVTCLKYYCRECWASNHSQSGGHLHKPLVKEGLGPQLIPWRWYFEPRS